MKRTALYRYGKQSLTAVAAGFAAALLVVSLPAGLEKTVNADVIDPVVTYEPGALVEG